MQRMGESTIVDIDDAGIQSLEIAVTEEDELIENGDESGARRLLFAELAAIRLWSRRSRLEALAALSSGPRRGARGQQVVVR